MSRRKAKQADFDMMVEDFIKQQTPLHEACIDAIETLTRSNYDLSNLYLYHNEEEYQEKQRIENRCKTIESILSNSSYLMNLSFAIKGLVHVFEDGANEEEITRRRHAIRLIETRKLFSILLSVLRALSESHDDEDGEDEDEGEMKHEMLRADGKNDHSAEKEESEEAKQLRRYYFDVFSFVNLLLSRDPLIYSDPEAFFSVQESQLSEVFNVLQNQLNQEKLVELILSFLLLLARFSEVNCALCRNSVVEYRSLLEKLSKIHSDNSVIILKVDELYTVIRK